MPKVLYLEDEHFLGRIVKESLESRGYEMSLVADGSKLMPEYKRFQPDICVLDVMVPNIDGLTLGKEIRALNPSIPIIYLTAKNQTQDVLEGFKSGGNDYIKKPFSMEELIVRIDNLLSLQGAKEKNTETEVRIGAYLFNPFQFRLQHKDQVFTLSHRENELVKLFSEHLNQKIDRRDILKKVWGDDSLYNSRNLDVYVRKLRQYFSADANIQLITLRGYGYHFSIVN